MDSGELKAPGIQFGAMGGREYSVDEGLKLFMNWFSGVLTVDKPFQEEGIQIREVKALNFVYIKYSLRLYHRVTVTVTEEVLLAYMLVLYKL